MATNAKVVPIPNVLVDACHMGQSAQAKKTPKTKEWLLVAGDSSQD